MRKSLLLLTATLLSGLVFVGCGGGNDQTTGETTTETKNVTVIDGRVDGAFVFADCNGNRVYDSGEPSAESVNGTAKLEIPSTCNYSEIIAVMDNATDIDLNVPVNGALIAPADSSVVSPLTTLVAVKPKVKEVLQKELGIDNPEQLNYVEEWDTLEKEAKSFIAGLIFAINTISGNAEDDATKIVAVGDFAKKIADKVETINSTNDTEIIEAIVDAINATETVESVNVTSVNNALMSFVENATSTGNFTGLASAFNEIISTAVNAIETITTVNATDEEILSYLIEGRFDLVRTLLEGNTDSDAKKVAYALALLGISVDTNFLGKIGSYIIPGRDEGFDLYGFRNEEEKEEIDKKLEEVNLSEWKESVTSLVKDIEEAIKKLDEVSDTVDFTIPSNFVEDKVVRVDKGSLDALKGLLLAKKALLEYLLTYDWSAYDNMTDEDAALPYLAKIKPVNTSYLSVSKENFNKALDYLKNAAKYESELPYDNYIQTLAYYITEKDNQGDINNLADITLTQIMDSLYGETVVENPEQTGSVTLSLSYLFEHPIDGSRIQADIDSGKIKEFKVCEGFYGYWNGEEMEYVCYDYENEIWFKQDSYLYEYLKAVSPDIEFDNRTLDNETWYTIDGSEYWNYGIAPVYPPLLPGVDVTLDAVKSFFANADGKTITFYSDQVVTCTLSTTNDTSFTLTDCSDPEYNGGGTVTETDEGVIIVDDTSGTNKVVYVDNNTIMVNFYDDELGYYVTESVVITPANETYTDDDLKSIIDGSWKIFAYNSEMDGWSFIGKCLTFNSTNNTLTISYSNGTSQSLSYSLENGTVNSVSTIINAVNDSALVVNYVKDGSYNNPIWIRVDSCQ